MIVEKMKKRKGMLLKCLSKYKVILVIFAMLFLFVRDFCERLC